MQNSRLLSVFVVVVVVGGVPYAQLIASPFAYRVNIFLWPYRISGSTTRTKNDTKKNAHTHTHTQNISSSQSAPMGPKNGTDIYGAQVLPRSTCLSPPLAPLAHQARCLLATKQKLKTENIQTIRICVLINKFA